MSGPRIPTTARVLALETALRDLRGLIESGYLVRDTSRDHEDGWALRQLRPVMILKEAAALVEDDAARDGLSVPEVPAGAS